MKKYFIFDIDGTLIDTEKTGVFSLMETVKTLMGTDMPYHEAYKYFGIPSIGVGPMLGYEGPEDFAMLWESNFVKLSHLIKAFDGVDEVLSAISQAGRRIGCVTSRNRNEFGKDRHLAKLLHYFDYCLCIEDTVHHKPHPEPLQKYFSLAGADPSECIYIGDTRNDCICARAAGCSFALADWMGRGLQGIEPDYYLTHPSEIIKLLEK